MRIAITVDVEAAPERVWQVMTDVERWPEWTASVKQIDRLDEGPFRVGSQARVQQPKLPAAVWTVTNIEEGNAFVWEAGGPGVRTKGRHAVEPRGPQGSRVTLELESNGIGALLLSPWMSRISRRYVSMEAAGLKRRSEAAA